jgi:transcriptional regulator with XRE-family HTH domain
LSRFVAGMSYHDDMTTTGPELHALLDRVNEATKLLQRSKTVPGEVGELIDSFEPTLGAATPLSLEADPYLTTTLWAAAFRAEKALRHDDDATQRRDVRIALEQFRHALRDIAENQPYNADAPVREVLARTVETLATHQKTLAELLGVSVRQLQRWLAEDGPEPAADDAARIRVVAQVVNQLRHSFTGPGVVAWFYREHPLLGRRPIELLDDPLSYPQVLGAATAARAMTA